MSLLQTFHRASLAVAVAALSACAQFGAQPDNLLPAALKGKAVLLSASDPDHARAVASAAVKPAGQGGVSEALVVKLTQDLPVWRLWSGPTKLDSFGRTNRIGSWWSYDAPRGSVAEYRRNYEICLGWNNLTWAAQCTLKAGAVVAIGPGQSVSAATCGDPSGNENYPANSRDWQTYVDKPWARPAELVCPAVEGHDYAVTPGNIARP